MNTQSGSRRVAVIGAGPVGLTALNVFTGLGHDVTCFEKASKVGGSWNFETTDAEKASGYGKIEKDGSVSCYYDGLYLNTSAKLFLVSGLQLDGLIDLPKGNWYSWKDLQDILHQVPSKYKIEPRLHLNTEVVKIDKLKNGWNVQYQNAQGNRNQEFEFVVCCTGTFRFPKFPEIPNMDKFNGVSLHNLQIRHSDKLFPGKKLLVIGGNYSGCDTVYLALQNQVEKVYWCMSRYPDSINTTIFKRNPDPNDPNKAFDMGINRLNWFENPDLLQQYVESIAVQFHKAKPDSRPSVFDDNLGILDDPNVLVDAEMAGKLVKIGPLKELTPFGAVTKNGDVLNDIDIVVYATGLKFNYSIIDHILSISKQEQLELYYHILPASEELDGLSFVGAQDAHLSFTTGTEQQLKWLATFWLNRKYDANGHIFSQEERSSLTKAMESYKQNKPPNVPYKLAYDPFVVAENMAEDLGVLPPDFRDLIKSGTDEDVALGIALMLGPYSPLQYVISGPFAVPSARDRVIADAKSYFGPEVWQSMVFEAMNDPEKFMKIKGVVQEKYKVNRLFDRIV